VGFSRVKPLERFVLYKVLCISFAVIYAGHNGDSCVYAGMLKERHIHLEKPVDWGCTPDQNLLSLSTIVFLSVSHYPYYEIPNF
jgi:hypothetical protein